MFESILASTSTVSAGEFVICTCISLGLGIVIAFIHTLKNEYSKNMLLALVALPAIIQSVIMLVNGNVGTGIAGYLQDLDAVQRQDLHGTCGL